MSMHRAVTGKEVAEYPRGCKILKCAPVISSYIFPPAPAMDS